MGTLHDPRVIKTENEKKVEVYTKEATKAIDELFEAMGLIAKDNNELSDRVNENLELLKRLAEVMKDFDERLQKLEGNNDAE